MSLACLAKARAVPGKLACVVTLGLCCCCQKQLISINAIPQGIFEGLVANDLLAGSLASSHWVRGFSVLSKGKAHGYVFTKVWRGKHGPGLTLFARGSNLCFAGFSH